MLYCIANSDICFRDRITMHKDLEQGFPDKNVSKNPSNIKMCYLVIVSTEWNIISKIKLCHPLNGRKSKIPLSFPNKERGL